MSTARTIFHWDKGIAGEALAEKPVNCVTNEMSLDIKDCCGQCYDGAANVHEKESGFATRILRMDELVLYTHCASHKLNLCAAASCQNQNVKNMMDNIHAISKFFDNSPKHQSLLEKMVKHHLPNYNDTKLIDVCHTLWILHIDDLTCFMDMFVPMKEAVARSAYRYNESRERSRCDDGLTPHHERPDQW